MNVTRTLTKPARYLRAKRIARANAALHRAEVERGATLEARADRTPILVLGSPRSGTTLLYQLLTEQLDVGYLSNVHMEHPADVSRVEREQRPRAVREASDFESEHGATAGAAGPHEAGEFWYRFFPRAPHQVHAADATPERTRALRAAVRSFADACGAPIVFKNVFNSLRIPVIHAALPEARYIHIERDLASNARSLLVGRLKRGELDAWWSARPDGSEAVADLSPAEQVVWQVQRMNEVTHEELAKLPAEHSYVVSYAELCNEPVRVIADIVEWLTSTGVRVDMRPGAEVPQSFEVRGGAPLPPDLDAALAAAVEAAEARGSARD